MDQDFHYYGTFMAARKGGFTKAAATLIAKAANFIDFLNEKSYPSSWTLVGGSKSYTITPRFTFQGDLFQTYQGYDRDEGKTYTYPLEVNVLKGLKNHHF